MNTNFRSGFGKNARKIGSRWIYTAWTAEGFEAFRTNDRAALFSYISAHPSNHSFTIFDTWGGKVERPHKLKLRSVRQQASARRVW